MPKEEHVHKFKRVIMGGKRVDRDAEGRKILVSQPGYPVYKCILPGCPTYIVRELMEGRKSICWRCGGELVITAQNLRQVRPVHRECQRSKKEAA